MKAFVKKIIKSYGQKELRIHASSAAFYIVVSALPLVTILVYILVNISPTLTFELEGLLKSILPSSFHQELYYIILGIKGRALAPLVPFSVITAIWSGSKGIGGLCYGIEAIYKIERRPHFLSRAIQIAWRTFIFYAIILGSLLVFALGRISSVKSYFLSIALWLRIPLFAIFLSIVFALIYSRLGNSTFKKNLLGGIFASVGWMLFTYFYSIYVRYSLDSSSIYAEMGTIIFFMLWVYFCVNIILIGAEINKR